MSVIATFTVPAAEFALGETLDADPEIRIQLSRLIPTGDSVIPYFWAADESVAAIEERLQVESDIESFEVIDRTDGEALIRVRWGRNIDGIIEAMREADASILEAEGGAGRWRFQVRFDEHEALSEFFRDCRTHGLEITLETVHNPGSYRPPTLELDLTDAQRETLTLALERSYFDVPRRTNLVELSEQLEISDSAVSQRLRRGVATVMMADESLRPEDDTR